MKKIFIDGSAGTTGLRIRERLAARTDLEQITLPEADRKDPDARAAALRAADAAFLCLPDEAAREAVALTGDADTVLIDASTAHRTLPDWAYGFPELDPAFAEKIRRSRRIAVPGCHASGFIALVYPLIKNGFLSPEAVLSCFSLTGYSGGGKKMIAEYESSDSPLLDAPRVYGLAQRHKHLKEMAAITGLSSPPVFLPTVGRFYAGMEVSVPLPRQLLADGKTADDVRALYASLYAGPVVRFADAPDENGFLSAAAFAGRDCMEISVWGNGDRAVLTARYDNLGKGASGAAVECLNLALGADPTTGLVLNL